MTLRVNVEPGGRGDFDREQVREALQRSLDDVGGSIFHVEDGHVELLPDARARFVTSFRDELERLGYHMSPADVDGHVDGAIRHVTKRQEGVVLGQRLSDLANGLCPQEDELRDPAFVPTAGQQALMRELLALERRLQSRDFHRDGYRFQSKDLGEYRDLVTACLDRAAKLRAAEDADRRAADRAARLEAQRAQPDPEPAGRVCAECGKKPAKVDDLCKRCAHDAGTLPHGKIGEG